MLPHTLNKQVRDFILQNVIIREDSELLDSCGGLAAVSLTKNGYELILGDKFNAALDRDKEFILYHEMAHLLRGDCLVMKKKQMGRQESMIWNISADAGINYGLEEESVKRLKGVWYPQLVDELGNNALPREWLPSTQQIYDVIKAQAKEVEQEMDGLFCEDGASAGELRRVHAKTLLNAREMLQDVKELEQQLRGAMNWGLEKSHGTRIIKSEPYPLPLASIILKHINGKSFGSRVNQRTFTREGRIPELRGQALLPRIKILAAIDVSGSCSHLVERFVGASRWLAKRHSVDLVAFDTDVYKFTPDVPVGGGTCFRPVYNHAELKKYDAILMLSDGCAGDVNPLPKMPVIWVLPKEHQRPSVRGADKIIVMDDA